MLNYVAASLLLASASLAAAQAAAPVSTPSTIPSAGASLEMPLLVVDHQHRPVDDVKVNQLSIKMGTAAAFAPLSLRRQGEDPLSLGILVDASRDSFHDLSKLGDEFALLVGTVLLPNDRVTLFAADCTMTRSLQLVAPDPAVLRKGFADALNYPTLHGGQTHSACGKTFHLWDDVSAVTAALAKSPGRRVLFVISSGFDGGSKYDWKTVDQYAFDQGVAIFALRDQRQAEADDYTQGSFSTFRGFGSGHFAPPTAPRDANNLELLCANDGGLTLTAPPEFRKDAIADILYLIKNRFILTIPRDSYLAATAHSAKVSAALSPYFMTATGAREPLEAK